MIVGFGFEVAFDACTSYTNVEILQDCIRWMEIYCILMSVIVSGIYLRTQLEKSKCSQALLGAIVDRVSATVSMPGGRRRRRRLHASYLEEGN